MSDSLRATEALGAAGATHPRVTLQDLVDSIARESYFTLDQALIAAGVPVSGDSHVALYTMCVLEMKNGFIQTGYSAPASPENFDAEKGKTFARENAIRQLWPIMGFALRERLSAGTSVG